MDFISDSTIGVTTTNKYGALGPKESLLTPVFIVTGITASYSTLSHSLKRAVNSTDNSIQLKYC